MCLHVVFRLLWFSSIFLSTALLTSCGGNKYYTNKSTSTINHAEFNNLLQQHVTANGMVNYKGFIADSIKLNNYIALLSNNPPSNKWTEPEQLAYWINAYNAFTIQLIIRNYPLESIKDIKKGITFVNSVWDIKFFEIGGEAMDLNKIEHGIIRKRFDEPRIHFAINCASFSCPLLRNEAYTAQKLEEQLEEQAISFINDKARNNINAQNPQLSKIFSWFSGDFKENGNSLKDFVNKYSQVKIDENAKLQYLDYDWSLNAQSGG